MRLISLNIWGGQVFEKLRSFIKESAFETDIFCFQEVFDSSDGPPESHGDRTRILQDLIRWLPDFAYVFHPVQNGFDNTGRVSFDIRTGPAIFVKKSIPIISSGEKLVFLERNGRQDDDFPANFHYVRLSSDLKNFTVCNLHGLSYSSEDGKLDTEDRLRQSEKVLEFVKGEQQPLILCGDFNVLPNTQIIRMLEKESFVNLISKFNIGTTRSRLHAYYGTPYEQKFSDYAFVSPSIKVRDFRVPDVSVSDHLPLILDFEIHP